jgi:hypothetical protein
MQNVGNETQYGVGGEAIADLVIIGDNMAVPCESNNGETFWLLLCDKPKHVVRHTFKDSYGNTYYEGDEVIRRRYYDLLCPRNMAYFFNNNVEPTYIYFHLVCVAKFGMPPTSRSFRDNYPTFQLPIDTLQLIEEAFDDLKQLHGDL